MALARFKAPAKQRDKGDYGKWAEKEVRKVLQEMSDAHLHFAFNRTLDARSAGGKFPAQAGDFQWFYNLPLIDITCNGIIEVKQVEHLYRLPFKNFETDDYARVHKRELAGSRVLVLVAHKLEKMKPKDVTWRALPLSYFADRNDVKGVGSWDLSEVPLVDYKAVLKDLIT